jgi:hypothetical protein
MTRTYRATELSGPPSRRTKLLWKTLAVGIILALSQPSELGLDLTSAMGLSGLTAGLAAYAIPGATLWLALWIGPPLMRAAPPAAGIAILIGLGGLVGAMSVTLDLFARLAAAIAWAGPLRQATLADQTALILILVSVINWALALAIAVFGQPVARAVKEALEKADAEASDAEEAVRDLRGRDLRRSWWGAFGWLGQAVALGGLLLAHAALAPSTAAQLGFAALALGGTGLFGVSSLSLWRGFDELERRMVMDAYAWSAIILTPVLLVWAMLEALGLIPAFSAYECVLFLMVLQIVIMVIIQIRISAAAAARPA